MIGKSSERGSGISVLAARHDDDNKFFTFDYFVFQFFYNCYIVTIKKFLLFL